MSLTERQIGVRIAHLRKLKGFSQDDIALAIGMPRSSLAKVEVGKRILSALELQRISLVLQFSVDEFLNESSFQNQLQPVTSSDFSDRAADGNRHNAVEKIRSVLLYILEACAGKPNVGETVLYKLLYFLDFNYYELYNDYLTGLKYRKLAYGPVPKNLDGILWQMITTGLLKRVKCRYQGFSQTRYIPLQGADLTLIKTREKEVIDNVIEQLSGMSAAAISSYSHNDVPWKESNIGEEIKYELAFNRVAPYSMRR